MPTVKKKWTRGEVTAKVEERYGKLDPETLQKVLNLLLSVLPLILPLFMSDQPLTSADKKKLKAIDAVVGLI